MNDANAALARLTLEQRSRLEQQLLSRSAPRVPEGNLPARYPRSLSFAQESLWYFDQLVPDCPLYNIPLAFHLKGKLDHAALRRALQMVVDRHEALRIRLVIADGVPGIAAVPRPFDLEVLDLSTMEAASRAKEIQRLLDEEARRPFALTKDWLFRARLLCADPEDHILTLTVHHIVADQTSLEILCQDLAEGYDSILQQRPAQFRAIRLLFSEWAEHQRRMGEGQAVSKHLAYWQSRLAGPLPELDVPTDRARGLSTTFQGARRTFQIPGSLSSALRRLSQCEGVTFYMLLLAAWQTFLYRYSRQDDILVGSPLSQRHQPGVQGVIGLFLNTIVVRTSLSGQPSFRELLHRTRGAVVGAFAHQEMPFEKLVEKLQLPRTRGRNPVFQTMFQYLTTNGPMLQLSGVEAKPLDLESGTAKFDLTLTLREGGAGLNGELEFRTDLFDLTTIDRMVANFLVLLEGIRENPVVCIDRLPLLTHDEGQYVLRDWNKTETIYPRDRTIPELFAAQIANDGELTAISGEARSLSYRELDEQSNQLARYLQRAGVQPRDRVGLCLPRSPELIVAMLAILKAGAAYVPADPTLPKARLARLLADAGVCVLITNQAGLPWDVAEVNVIGLDQAAEAIAHEEKAALRQSITAEDLAYVMFTSGSTGEPKGVAVPHRAVVRLVKETNYARFESREVFLQFAPVSFDASTFEIWGALLNGAKLVLYPASFESLAQLATILRQSQITTLWLTAGLFHQLVDHDPEALLGLRQLLAGGDVLSVPHIRKALEHLPEGQLINGYGPTENTTFSCCYRFPRDWPGTRPAPIGRPVSNSQAFVLDSQLAPVPIGVVGELCVAGDGLAHGYWNSPALTAEKFVAHPFDSRPGARLYRTGDQARFLPDGNLEFCGRRDDQVKVNGFRVHLAEVEAALLGMPQVRQAAVLAHASADGAKQLTAYLVPHASAPRTAGPWRAALSDRLPAYMVPAHYVLLNELPVTPNGKVDRRSLLPPQNRGESLSAQPQSGPESSLHEQIAATWREAFGRDAVGLDEDFFELGGHSLLATRIVARLNQKLQINLSLASLFQAPTIRALAQRIRTDGTVDAAPPIRRRASVRSNSRPTPTHDPQVRARSAADGSPQVR